MNRLHDILGTISNLTSLTELRVTNIEINLAYFDPEANPPLEKMQILHFDDSEVPPTDDHGDAPTFNGKDWCHKIATFFPNLQQLTVRSKDKKKLAEIKKNLKVFSNLRTNLLCSKDDRKRFIGYFGRFKERYQKDRRPTKPKNFEKVGLFMANE